MLEFYKKHKEELKRPMVYIGVGIMILAIGAFTGNLESITTIFFGVGPIVFALRDILALAMKDYN